MQKYKKRGKLHSIKNQKSASKQKNGGMQTKRFSKGDGIDMLTIPEEMSSRAISTRRIGRLSKRSNYAAIIEDMEFNPKPLPPPIDQSVTPPQTVSEPVVLTEVENPDRRCLTSKDNSVVDNLSILEKPKSP